MYLDLDAPDILFSKGSIRSRSQIKSGSRIISLRPTVSNWFSFHYVFNLIKSSIMSIQELNLFNLCILKTTCTVTGEGRFSLLLAGAWVLVSSCGLLCSRETTCTVVCRFVHRVWMVVWLSFLLWACVYIFCGVVRVCLLWLACLRRRGCSPFASSLINLVECALLSSWVVRASVGSASRSPCSIKDVCEALKDRSRFSVLDQVVVL